MEKPTPKGNIETLKRLNEISQLLTTACSEVKLIGDVHRIRYKDIEQIRERLAQLIFDIV